MSDTATLTGETICTECSMKVSSDEFHPYAACLMFKGCGSGDIVRSNLQQLKDYSTNNAQSLAELVAMFPNDHRVRLEYADLFQTIEKLREERNRIKTSTELKHFNQIQTLKTRERILLDAVRNVVNEPWFQIRSEAAPHTLATLFKNYEVGVSSVDELIDAAWQVLDDMGEDCNSCCLASKASLRAALEQWMFEHDGDGLMSLEAALDVIHEISKR